MPGINIEIIPVDYTDLLSLMKEQRIKQVDMTRALGDISHSSMWRNVRNGRPLDGKVVMAMIPVLGINEADIGKYFFHKKMKRRAKA